MIQVTSPSTTSPVMVGRIRWSYPTLELFVELESSPAEALHSTLMNCIRVKFNCYWYCVGACLGELELVQVIAITICYFTDYLAMVFVYFIEKLL